MQSAAKEQPAAPVTNSVRVEIFDQAYNLRGTDPEYIRRLAEFVDGKMRVIAEQTSTVDSLRLAVLAALNIADEYHLMKHKLENGGISDYAARTQRLAGALDEVLLEEKRRMGERSA